jgi:hypothetical protein
VGSGVRQQAHTWGVIRQEYKIHTPTHFFTVVAVIRVSMQAAHLFLFFRATTTAIYYKEYGYEQLYHC